MQTPLEAEPKSFNLWCMLGSQHPPPPLCGQKQWQTFVKILLSFARGNNVWGKRDNCLLKSWIYTFQVLLRKVKNLSKIFQYFWKCSQGILVCSWLPCWRSTEIRSGPRCTAAPSWRSTSPGSTPSFRTSSRFIIWRSTHLTTTLLWEGMSRNKISLIDTNHNSKVILCKQMFLKYRVQSSFFQNKEIFIQLDELDKFDKLSLR